MMMMTNDDDDDYVLMMMISMIIIIMMMRSGHDPNKIIQIAYLGLSAPPSRFPPTTTTELSVSP